MDIAIAWDAANYRGDWTVTSGDLTIDPGGLRTAVLLSLFTDRVAPPDYVAPAGSPQGRRGYWADTYEGFPLGSLLWTLNRRFKSGDNTLLSEATDICLAALQWLIDANIVASVSVTCSWLTSVAIGISVTLTPPQSPPQIFEFGWAWQGA
jgi:phage gp46-like protein